MDIRYFDNSATTRVKEDVLKEMIPYLSVEYGNPSSIYSIARNAKRAIEDARKKVASLINCKPEEIYFTSCGSESDNTALKGIAYANKDQGNHIITSKIEHPAILNSCKNLESKGFEVTYLDVDKNGFVNLETLKKSIRKDTILISIMFANNEIGTVEPIEEIAQIAHKNNITFHTDAVQAVREYTN
jgi:cysteine desulfurase